MKKIVASIMGLLMMCSFQTSAVNNESKAKKVVYNVCTKVLPVAAVTLGVGMLVKKFVLDREDFAPSAVRPEVVSKKTKKTKKTKKYVLSEEEAYSDGIRYIRWHHNMCWFNASILYLYYNDYYRNFLCDLKEDTYKEEDIFKKKVTIELAKLVKKIANSPTCMCELTENDYNRVLSLYREGKSEDEKRYLTFGQEGMDMTVLFTSAINSYTEKSMNGSLNHSKNSSAVVYKSHHYYHLYYSGKTNRLYSIGESVDSRLERSVFVVDPDSKQYKLFKNPNRGTTIINN